MAKRDQKPWTVVVAGPNGSGNLDVDPMSTDPAVVREALRQTFDRIVAMLVKD